METSGNLEIILPFYWCGIIFYLRWWQGWWGHLRIGKTGWPGVWWTAGGWCLVQAKGVLGSECWTGGCSVWKSGHRTGKRPWPDQTVTEKDCKLSGLTKTITAVQSTVLYRFQTFKTEQKTGFNRLKTSLSTLQTLVGPSLELRI